MKNRTINEAIIEVLKNIGKPMTIDEIYNSIIQNDYYKFKAERPRDIVRIQVRRHCVNLNFPTASNTKYFEIFPDGTFYLCSVIKKIPKHLEKESKSKKEVKRDLIELHSKYIEEFKKLMLGNLKNISPEIFEHFCKKLLEVYGFKDLKVTNVKKDGGIDGFGKLKVGISFLNVAFQSKRWKNSIVGRTEIDKFRGAIQGDFEQGIFITTSSFSRDALNATTKKGAVPIILIDGLMIVDIMIEKKFGVQIEELPIYINALDEILT